MCRFAKFHYLRRYPDTRREKAVLCVPSSKPDIFRDVPPGKLLEAFRHPAFWNEERLCIEMQLHAVKDTVIRVVGKHFDFAQVDSIHTGNSYKL